MGRSPLARGRRRTSASSRGSGGSIPARAGQTRGCCKATRCSKVDPRSRGADPCAQVDPVVAAGRSPLARGRPIERMRARWEPGSIPARAGQTEDAGEGVEHPGVDPRSRGADRRPDRDRLRGLGRSPLARGRRVLGFLVFPVVRSIPARAGQTGRGQGPPAFAQVDPRSRGADSRFSPLTTRSPGRSPLARGRPQSLSR